MLIVRSPVRISFGGGGTDLPAYYEQFGGAVLNVAIDKYFYTILRGRDDDRVQIISSDLRVFESWRNIANMPIQPSELEIPLAVLRAVGCPVSIDLILASQIPPGTGLGSSASICVNILKALSSYLQRLPSKYELAEQAFEIARTVIGKHVGKQDEYAASFGGLNYISFHQDGSSKVESLNLDAAALGELQSNLMLFFTGAAQHSCAILREQEDSTRAHAPSTLDALHEVKALSGSMRDALRRGELSLFGKLLDDGWKAKRRVSNKIATPRIDQLYALAREHGAIGGKITGAGGGGFLLIYCEPTRHHAVRAALAAEGVPEMAFNFDFHGAQTIVNDPFIDADGKDGFHWTFNPTRTRAAAS
jgi:D-glycero-alpha-D-manno-heptose-7-phosphate kinase